MQPAKIASRYLRYLKDTNNFEISLTTIPAPKDDEVLLKVLATSINRVDILEKRGTYKAVQDNEILGVEVVGVEVDPESLHPKSKTGGLVGGIVRGGAYAEFISMKKDHLIPFDFESANFLGIESPSFSHKNALNCAGIPEAFLTAFQILELYAKPKPEEWVYIPAGAGGIGTAAIQLAKQIYGAKVIASCSNEEKAKLCKSLGADTVVIYTDKTPELFHAEIIDATSPKGVNCILDCIGPANADLHGQIIAEDGRWVLYGLLGNKKLNTSQNIMNHILFKRVQLIGTLLRNRDGGYKAELTKKFNEKVLPLFQANMLSPVVGHYFVVDWNGDSGDGMAQAHKLIEANSSVGRIVVGFTP